MDFVIHLDVFPRLLTLVTRAATFRIDNIIFMSIAFSFFPLSQQKPTRHFALLIALICRITFLAALAWIMHLIVSAIIILSVEYSGRSLLLISGGFFLIYRAAEGMRAVVTGVEETLRKQYQ